MVGREERFQMRQRGAGSRDIQLSFDLELPGLPKRSRSPLVPRKSTGLKIAPQADVVPPLESRPTPRPRKSKPALSSKRTPATAGRGKINTAEEDLKSSRKKPLKSSSMSVTNLQGIGDNVTRKRKIAPGILDGTDEVTSVASPKKRRKRRSIGQQSVGRKAKGSLKARAPRKGPGPAANTAESTIVQAAGEPNTLGVLGEYSNEVVQNLESKEAYESHPVPDPLRVPKRRKRRSVGQIRIPKKKLKSSTEQQEELKEVERTTNAEEYGFVPATRSSGEFVTEDTPVREPQRHRRGSTAQAVSKPKRPLDETLEDAEDALRPARGRKPREPAAKTAKRAAPAVNPTKKGRKKRLDPVEEAPGHQPDKDIQESEQNEAQSPVKPPFENDEIVAKPQRKAIKGRGTSREQPSGKKSFVATQNLPHAPTDENARLENGEASLEEPIMVNAKVPRRRNGRAANVHDETTGNGSDVANDYPEPNSAPKKCGRPKKHLDLLMEASGTTPHPAEEISKPAAGPKKRGRPRKAAPLNNQTAFSGGNLLPTVDNVMRDEAPVRQKRAHNAKPAPVPSSVPAREEADQKESDQSDREEVHQEKPSIQADSTVMPPPQPKKRGRPKKQTSGTVTTKTITKGKRPRKPKKSPEAPPENHMAPQSDPPVNPKSAEPQAPLASDALNEAEGNASDDPISELTLLRESSPKKRSFTKNLKKNILPRAPKLPKTRKASAPDSDTATSKPKNSNPIPKPAVPKNAPVKETTPPAAPTQPIDPPPNDPEAIINDSASHETDLASLRASQAADLAELKERETTARLAALSESVRKRKLEARARTDRMLSSDSHSNLAERKNDDVMERRREASKGLEGFVFQRVERKGRNKAVVGGGEEEIDPELQRMLSQVRGVQGGVVKIF